MSHSYFIFLEIMMNIHSFGFVQVAYIYNYILAKPNYLLIFITKLSLIIIKPSVIINMCHLHKLKECFKNTKEILD